MTLIFDTSVIIGLERNDKHVHETIRRLQISHPGQGYTSFMTYFEFIHGLRNKQVHNRDSLLSFLDLFEMLIVTKDTARIMSEIKSKYDLLGVPLSLADTLIAAQAIEHGMALVTRDKAFDQIASLRSIIF